MKLPSQRRVGAACSLLALLCAAPRTRAEGAPNARDKQRATALLREGATFLDHEDFAEALGKFTEAYGLVASPKIQFNIGLAQEGLARPADASRAYQIYVDGATTDAAARRAEAQGRIVALRGRVTLLHITSDVTGTAIAVDGADEGHTPLPRPLVVSPGAHQVVLQAPGVAAWTRAIRGEGGGTVELRANLQPPPVVDAPPPKPVAPVVPAAAEPAQSRAPTLVATPAPPPADDDAPIYKRGWFWLTVGGVVAATAVTTLLLLPHDTKYACQVPPCL
ncbi:MAG: hypothetical protein JWM82_2361 [Myxococcales bacterium]|nr:hypothetical protein [Myxococcales bacterium]